MTKVLGVLRFRDVEVIFRGLSFHDAERSEIQV